MTRKLLHIAFISVTLAAAAFAASASVSAQQGQGGSARTLYRGIRPDEGPRPQAFSVVLVLGEMQGTGGSDTVPPAARKALTDVKDFLPYKSYRLLDAQWTLCCGQSMVTRLRGPEDQDYGLELNPRSAGSGKWSVHFSLWEPRSADRADSTVPSSAAAASTIERTILERRLADLRKTNGENHPDVVRLRAQLEELGRTSAARREESMRRTMAVMMPRRAVIDTSFMMEIGETVVVGTSRLKGDKALIALLTAVAPAKTSGR